MSHLYLEQDFIKLCDLTDDVDTILPLPLLPDLHLDVHPPHQGRQLSPETSAGFRQIGENENCCSIALCQ